jgi:hypothetical protein
MQVAMILVFLLDIMLLWFYVTFLVMFVFYCICFRWISIIRRHQPCYSAPYVYCLSHACYLAYCWGHVVQYSRFMPLYLLKSTYNSTWKFWWKLSPASLAIARVQVVTNCVFMHFSTTLWAIQFVVIFKSVAFVNFWSSFSFHLLSLISFTTTLSIVFFLRLSKYSIDFTTCD